MMLDAGMHHAMHLFQHGMMNPGSSTQFWLWAFTINITEVGVESNNPGPQLKTHQRATVYELNHAATVHVQELDIRLKLL